MTPDERYAAAMSRRPVPATAVIDFGRTAVHATAGGGLMFHVRLADGRELAACVLDGERPFATVYCGQALAAYDHRGVPSASLRLVVDDVAAAVLSGAAAAAAAPRGPSGTRLGLDTGAVSAIVDALADSDPRLVPAG